MRSKRTHPFNILGEEELIVYFIGAAGLAEQVQQLLYRQMFLFLTGNIDYDLAVVHHDQTVAIVDGITHVVGDHEGGQIVLAFRLTTVLLVTKLVMYSLM